MLKRVQYFYALFIVVSLTFLSLSSDVHAQVAPHPRLLQQIKSGRRVKPFTLSRAAAMKEKGIDAPWASEELKARKVSDPAFPRSFGPARVPSGSWRALVILVQFSDKPKSVEASAFDNMLFGSGSGTLRDYYKKVSYGNLDIVTVNLPGTLGWQTAPQTYAYYCNAQNGTGSYPNNSQKLTEDLVNMIDPAVDFSQYDNDNDGEVDALFIIHTGPGAEYTGDDNDIWSHAWATYNTPQLDGVKILHYSIEPEYWAAPGDMTIGVYAHELGHAAFGLPDLYDRDNSSEGLGNWSLMASGSWCGNEGDTPSYPDAWSRIQMGYVTPTVVTANTLQQSIPDAENNTTVFKLWKGGIPGNEYFLVENRQKTSYDAALPGSGLAVYHVDEDVYTQNDNEWYPGNTAAGHYLVAMEQADGLYDLEKGNYRGNDGDPFPGTANKLSFSGSTVPDSKQYDFKSTGVALKNISASALTMKADIEVTSSETILSVLSPNGGELWPAGYTKQIKLDALNTGSVKVEYTTDNGATWVLIGTADPAVKRAPRMTERSSEAAMTPERDAAFTGSVIDWVVPDLPSNQCKIRATCVLNPSLRDESDNPFAIVAVPDGQFSIQFNYDAQAVTGNNGNAGAVFIPSLNEFWTSRWNSTLFHRWSKDGSLIAEFSIPGVSNVRGMTFDGTSIYASNNSCTISIIDPNTRTLTGTITSPLDARYVTYDPSANEGQGGLWVGNYTTDLTLISKAGASLNTIGFGALGANFVYGAAFDNLTPGGPYIWLADQGAADQRLIQVKVSTGLPTGIEHDLLTDIGAADPEAVSGGIFVSSGITPGKATIGGILQSAPDRLFGYQLADLEPNVTVVSPNGGEILKSGSKIDISWWSGLISNIKAEFTTDNGTSWTVISASTPAANKSLIWTIPNVVSSQCKIRLSDASNASVLDLSDNLFIINISGPTAEAEPNNSTEKANSVFYGSSLDASISPQYDVDYFKIIASAGDTLVIYAYDQNASSLDGELKLIDSEGNIVKENDDYSSTSDSKIIHIAPGSGKYYVKFSHYSDNSASPALNSPLKGSSKHASGFKKSPQLSSASGDYKITFSKFSPSSPVFAELYSNYQNYNSAALGIVLNPNGLKTSIRIDYGTTDSYGNSVTLTELPDSLELCTIEYMLQGLQPSTVYHLKVTLSNSMGQVESSDWTLITPAAPEGWVLQTSGTRTNLLGVDFTDAMTGIAVGEHGTWLKTTDGGNGWVKKTYSSSDWLGATSFTDANIGTVAGQSGLILRTTNGGDNWIKQTSGTTESLYSVCFTDQNTGTAVGSNGVILRTTNGGSTWATQISGTTEYLLSVYFTDANYGIIAGSSGTILRTTNGGITWAKQTSGTAEWLFWVSFADANTGIAVGTQGVILRTTNGGIAWSQQTSGTTERLNSVGFMDEDNGWIAGEEGIILKTTDGGLTWVSQASGTTAPLYAISAGNNSVYAVGEYGMIVKQKLYDPVVWQGKITASNAGKTETRQIAFGQAQTATDGIDVSLGETGISASGGFDVKFKLPSADYSLRDYRADSLKAVDWLISIQPGTEGLPLTLEWDSNTLPEGSFILKDVIDGSKVNLNMKQQNSFTLNDAALTALKVEYRRNMTKNVALLHGWNLISVPVKTIDMQSSVLLPEASSPAYGFAGSYQNVTTLENGKGYWSKYPKDTTMALSGNVVNSIPVALTAGWNLIGIYDRSLPVSSLSTTPLDILTTPFYAYSGSYQATQLLESGKGYWIRASQNGVINLNYTASPMAKQAGLNIVSAEVKSTWGRVIFEDNAGHRTVLYRAMDEKDLKPYDLPPMPPSGIFDVRYTTDRYVENSNSANSIKLSSAVFPVRIKAEEMNIKIKDKTGGNLVDKILRKGESMELTDSQIELLSIENVEIPQKYELLQNYPNPFNPSTIIRFGVPERTEVSLTIYNQLGEKVKELVSGLREAGEYQVEWNASECSSGIYFYELRTKNFRAAKKLVLIK